MLSKVSEKKYIVKMNPQEAKQLFVFGLRLSEIAEDILEEHGEYNQRFILGLKKSLKEARNGKLFRINSLHELI